MWNKQLLQIKIEKKSILFFTQSTILIVQQAFHICDAFPGFFRSHLIIFYNFFVIPVKGNDSFLYNVIIKICWKGWLIFFAGCKEIKHTCCTQMNTKQQNCKSIFRFLMCMFMKANLLFVFCNFVCVGNKISTSTRTLYHHDWRVSFYCFSSGC